MRKKRCICFNKYQKRTHKDLVCECSASVLKESLLNDTSIFIVRLNKRSIADNLHILDPVLLKLRTERIRREEEERISKKAQAKQSAQVDMSTAKKTVVGEVKLDADWERTLQDLIANVTTDDHKIYEVIEEFQEAFEYKGFDPERLRAVIMHYYSKYVQTGTTLELAKGKFLTFGGRENADITITFFIQLFNLRGNNTDAIKAGLDSPTLKKNFTALIDNMRIKPRVITPGETKSRDTVTLSRIAACFPLHTLSIAAHASNTRKVIDMSDVGIRQVTKFEKYLCCPVAASTLPDALIKQGFAKVTFLASLKLNKLIGGKSKTTLPQLWNFHLAALKSKAVGEAAKATFWKDIVFEDFTNIIGMTDAILKTELAKAEDLYEAIVALEEE